MLRPTVLRGIFLLASVGCSTEDFEGLGANAPSDAGSCVPHTPVAPSASEFMWQGRQTSFLDAQGQRCEGRVSIAMGDQSLCFVASDDTMRCAGSIYTRTFGNTFVSTTEIGVDQILIAPTVNALSGNRICVHKIDGTASCMGEGQFMEPATATFVPWGNGGIVAIGTGTWDEVCELDNNTIRCTGHLLGPGLVDAGTGQTFWIDTFGTLHSDDPTVFRAGNGRSVVQIESGGLSREDGLHGTPGKVVDGNEVPVAPSFSEDSACWLETSGSIFCETKSSVGPRLRVQRFAQGTALALAASPYTDSLCAVFNDGSLWCMGSNLQGKLGTGDTDPLRVETMVQPPGSVLTH